jgi:hypothetical protein
MNDLEICKRIAEIEKIHVSNAECGMYDPLTDKALCFNLMVKYMRFFKIQTVGNLTVICVHDLETTSPQDLLCIVKNTDPQKAICLAVIEANEKNKTTWLRDSNTKTNKGK